MIKKVIIATIVVLGLTAASQVAFADEWNNVPVCSDKQLSQGYTDVGGVCTAPQPSPQPTPQPTPSPVTVVPAPVPPVKSPQPAGAPAPTAPVDTFQGK